MFEGMTNDAIEHSLRYSVDFTNKIIINLEQFLARLHEEEARIHLRPTSVRLNPTQEYLLRLEVACVTVDMYDNPMDASETPLQQLYGCKVWIG